MSKLVLASAKAREDFTSLVQVFGGGIVRSSPSAQNDCSRTSKKRAQMLKNLTRRLHAALFKMFLLSAFTLLACSQSHLIEHNSRIFEAWDVINDPDRFGRNFETHYRDLPTSGSISRIPWSDSYWPSQRAGIAYRWLNPGPSSFGYSLPSRQTVQGMTREELSALSPAEKLDIFVGRFEYPTVLSERRRTYPGAAPWEGLCHGWAPASLEFLEPHPVTLKGPSNISVPFGSSDVKALLSWYMALRSAVPAIGLGGRCDIFSTLGLNTPRCRDANAGAFHIVLANQIGRQREGFVIDLARYAEVWNQPVYAFQSREIGRQGASPGAAPGTTQEVVVESQVFYTIEIEPTWNALGQTLERPMTNSVIYRYRLELDAQGTIRGGEWLQEARPDFLWIQQRGAFTGADAAIGQIYEAAIR